jgi:hypothetical protein
MVTHVTLYLNFADVAYIDCSDLLSEGYFNSIELEFKNSSFVRRHFKIIVLVLVADCMI